MFTQPRNIRSPAIRLALAILLIASGSAIMAQRMRGPGREMIRVPDRGDYPQWELPKDFAGDAFVFARVQYDSYGWGRGGENWRNDYPDCDWNFSARLKQLTSLDVHPTGVVLRLSDPNLRDYPFLYMSNPQQMSLSDEEVDGLRRYLLNGGFIMVDDFWAPQAWRHVRGEFERIFPDRRPRELSLDYELFHVVYDLKELPQVPSILAWRNGDKFEYWHGDPEGDEAPHFYGIFDDAGRLMALLCHNNDIGDGWEREGENREYFEQYSEKFSYPLGINIVTYVLTH